jgi:acyl-homoserine lactone acylase PvdQ
VADCRADPHQLASNGRAVDLTQACNALAGYDGTVALNASYAQVQHAPQSRAIAIRGCDTGCFNAIYSADAMATSPVDAAPYGQVYDGSSLVMTTQLNPNGPVSRGILTYSQATDPTSPWYSNLTRLYARRKWVELAYTASELRRERHRASLTLRAP